MGRPAPALTFGGGRMYHDLPYRGPIGWENIRFPRWCWVEPALKRFDPETPSFDEGDNSR
jgi:hypothetical protein